MKAPNQLPKDRGRLRLTTVSLFFLPQDAKLTPWPDKLLKSWESLTDEEKKLFIRQADVYGAYLAYTDHEIGRVIQAVEDMVRPLKTWASWTTH